MAGARQRSAEPVGWPPGARYLPVCVWDRAMDPAVRAAGMPASKSRVPPPCATVRIKPITEPSHPVGEKKNKQKQKKNTHAKRKRGEGGKGEGNETCKRTKRERDHDEPAL
jgi:hypothetical protein